MFTRKNDILTIYCNCLKYTKSGDEFYLEPEQIDLLGEYMNVIMLLENYNSVFKYNLSIIKSKYDYEEYLIELNKNKLCIHMK
jgi:hypothetical protein